MVREVVTIWLADVVLSARLCLGMSIGLGIMIPVVTTEVEGQVLPTSSGPAEVPQVATVTPITFRRRSLILLADRYVAQRR